MSASRVIVVGGPPNFRPQVAQALRANPEEITWVQDVATAEAAVDPATSPCDLLVLSPLVEEAEAVALARSLSRRSPATAIVVVRTGPPDGVLPRLVRAGVRDVVDGSKGRTELEEALGHAIAWSESLRHAAAERGTERSRGRVVSLFSTKGGCGKTFLATNLAAAIAERSRARTALVDLDVDMGDVFAYFGEEPTRSLAELATEVARGTPDAEIAALGSPLGEGVIGFGSPPNPGAPTISADAMADVVRALRSAFPFVVMDATCDYTEPVVATLEASDDILLVTGLDVISVRHLSLGMQTLENLGIDKARMRVVLNRADSKVELGVGDIERALDLRVDARIPSSAVVPRSINRSTLLWYGDRRSAVARSIGDLAPRRPALRQRRRAVAEVRG